MADPTNKRVQITLPRISFEINSIEYDGTRKVAPTQKVTVVSTTDKSKTSFMPVPYNIGFELAIISKNQEDGLEILEQILCNFQPSYNLPMKLVPDLNETKDVPVILNSVGYEDDYEGNFAQRRAIIYTLTFTAKTYVYGPISESLLLSPKSLPTLILLLTLLRHREKLDTLLSPTLSRQMLMTTLGLEKP